MVSLLWASFSKDWALSYPHLLSLPSSGLSQVFSVRLPGKVVGITCSDTQSNVTHLHSPCPGGSWHSHGYAGPSYNSFQPATFPSTPPSSASQVTSAVLSWICCCWFAWTWTSPAVTMGNCPKAQKKEKGEVAPVPVRCITGVICYIAVWLN